MRVFVGTFDIANNVTCLADGFRALGYPTATGVIADHEFYADNRYDYRIVEIQKNVRIRIDNRGDVDLTVGDVFKSFIEQFDLFVFVAGFSLLPGNFDYPLLKNAGKRIICWHAGSEIRHWSAAEPMWRDWQSEMLFHAADASRRGHETTISEVIALSPYDTALARKLHTMRMTELYADTFYAQPEMAGLAIRPYMMTVRPPFAVDRVEPRIPGRDKPVVVHAPTARKGKGTPVVLASVNALREDGGGVDFDFRLIENMPHRTVLAELRNADILIDEIYYFALATLAVEGMASGCCVLCGNDEDVIPFPKGRPVLNVNKETLTHRLRQAIVDKALRIDLAKRGVAFAQHYNVTKIIEKLMADLRPSALGEFDYFPEYFTHYFQPDPADTIPDYLRDVNLESLRRFGVPHAADIERMRKIGLIPADTHEHGIHENDFKQTTVTTAPHVHISRKGMNHGGAVSPPP